MHLSISNNNKVINLNCGKTLPEWISENKRRKLEKKDFDIRKRVQLIQDLEMPSISRTIHFTPDGHYLFATGSYKPTIKCFDLNELSIKFERCLDADVIKMCVLGDDFTKFILLEEQRFVEFHTNYGNYFRLRIPHFGRDIAFCSENSEAYIVGCHNEIFRLNLELGSFNEPLKSQSESLTCCQFNDHHQLFVNGTNDGRVEAWDYRDKKSIATLDCVLNKAIAMEIDIDSKSQIEVSSLCFKDALRLAVGLSNGYVLLYDIRSSQPYLSKSHNFDLPISRVEFAQDKELVMSMDERSLKLWNEHDGKPFITIEPGTDLNDFARYQNSGVIFFANDEPKVKQFFIPSLGPAPKWCSHLESITEELETMKPTVYDDFKFVTKAQLEELGLQSLLGTNNARAYMHGYFIDMKIYMEAKNHTHLNAVEAYREKKVQEKLEKERTVNFVKKDNARKLPKVNRELASRLLADLSIHEQTNNDEKAIIDTTVFEDKRFTSLFTDPDFEINEYSEQYKQLEPMIKKLETKKRKIEEQRISKTRTLNEEF